MYKYELEPESSTHPYRVSNPDTGEMFWVATEEEARSYVEQGNCQLMLPDRDPKWLAGFIEFVGDMAPDMSEEQGVERAPGRGIGFRDIGS